MEGLVELTFPPKQGPMIERTGPSCKQQVTDIPGADRQGVAHEVEIDHFGPCSETVLIIRPACTWAPTWAPWGRQSAWAARDRPSVWWWPLCDSQRNGALASPVASKYTPCYGSAGPHLPCLESEM